MHDNEPTGTLDELPAPVQSLIRTLRRENRQLRERLADARRLSEQELPASWEKKIREYRKENGRYRVERNAALVEVAQLRAEIAELAALGK